MNEAVIVDLCSGSGGPMPRVAEQLVERFPGLRVTLTDLYPKPEVVRSDRAVRYHPEPVDARAVPAHLVGIRTMFSALHHFEPSQVQQMLADAAHKGQPVAFFEFQRRAFWSNFVPPTGLAQLAPWVLLWSSPFRWWRLLLGTSGR
ncbi:MAG: class I SAM-dependent methyltransferase [Myxococcales bacterium]|nr:class I SAM-dependent methyltransferase [Myxococcales bacterium]